MARKNRKCLSCSVEYSYCPNCSNSDKLAPSWKAEFCSEDCMTLWKTLTKYGMDRLTKSEAKSIISELELKPIESYVKCVQRDYKLVMEDENKFKRGKRAEVIIDEPVEESHEVVTIENE